MSTGKIIAVVGGLAGGAVALATLYNFLLSQGCVNPNSAFYGGSICGWLGIQATVAAAPTQTGSAQPQPQPSAMPAAPVASPAPAPIQVHMIARSPGAAISPTTTQLSRGAVMAGTAGIPISMIHGA